MSDIKWIKLSVNMFDDEKIKLIRTMPEGDAIVIIWVQILCLAGKINDSGMVYMGQNLAYSDEMLATILDHPVNTMRIALKTLEQFGMVEVNEDGTIDVLNWEKHQSTDKMARIREQNRRRKRRYDLREKIRRLGHNPDDEKVPQNVSDLEEYVNELEESLSNVTVTLPEEVESNGSTKKEEESRSDGDSGGNVTVTLGNATEVRGKKKEERSKKEDVRGKKKEVNTTTEKKEENPEKSSSGDKLPSRNVFVAFEKLWMFPNFVQKEILIEFSELYGDDLTFAAIRVAGANDVEKGRSINFIEAVLKEWANNNVKTIEQAREYTKNRNKQNKRNNYSNQSSKKESLPDWANEENESVNDKEASEEDKINVKERLEKIRAMRAGEKS